MKWLGRILTGVFGGLAGTKEAVPNLTTTQLAMPPAKDRPPSYVYFSIPTLMTPVAPLLPGNAASYGLDDTARAWEKIGTMIKEIPDANYLDSPLKVGNDIMIFAQEMRRGLTMQGEVSISMLIWNNMIRHMPTISAFEKLHADMAPDKSATVVSLVPILARKSMMRLNGDSDPALNAHAFTSFKAGLEVMDSVKRASRQITYETPRLPPPPLPPSRHRPF